MSRPVPTLSIAACAVCVVPALPAQWQFAEMPRAHVPAIADQAHAVSAGDVDGDGDLDLAVGTDGQCRLLLGDGRGRFTDATPGRLPQRFQYCLDVVLFDCDGDGDLDLYCANHHQDWLYRNDGTGTFSDITAAALPIDTTNEYRVLAVDVDGDGDRDLVACPQQLTTFPLRIWRNQGGVFVDGTAQALAGITGWVGGRVVPVDVDGDGDQDLVAPGWTNHLLRNDGGGVFSDASNQLPAGYTMCTAVASLDADGDNDLDLVFGCTGQDRLCRNDGTGVFTDATGWLPADNDATAAVAAFDADGDGDADLLFANRGPDRFYRNDQGTFTDQSGGVPQQSDSGRLVIADVDGDNDLDVCLAGESDIFAMVQTLQLWLNAGQGVFHDGSARPLPMTGHAPALQDIDGDGDLDCFLGSDDVRPSQLFRNDGTGWFTDVSAAQLPSGSDLVRAATFGDVDGDGDADLLLACVGADRLWRNDGTGTFTDVTTTQLPLDAVATEAVVLTDLDGDGDLDAVTAGSGHHRLLRNDGTGTFADVSAAQAPVTSLATTGVAAGDVDGDGDRDLLFSFGWPAQQALWLNDGAGTFTDGTATRLLQPFAAGARSVVLVDVDGDLDLDLVAGANGQNRLFVNDGSGWFADDTLLRLPTDNDDTSAVAAGDVDGDGDIDLVFGNVYSPLSMQFGPNRLCINDGSGHFVDETLLRLEATRFGSRSLALGDADGDGDLDLFGAEGLFVNRSHQLHAPLLLRPGYDWLVEAFASFAPAGTTDIALPWLSTTRMAIPVPPLGTLGIVPQVALPAMVVPQPAGVTSSTWPVPNAPALVGVSIYVQALQLSLPGAVRLSNVVADTLVH
jgi:hypothetical protein